MTTEQIYEASEQWCEDSSKPYISKNSLFKGLEIFSKYTDDMSIGVGHEELWLGFQSDEEEKYENLTKEDLEVLFTHGFYWDSGYDCFHKFL